MFVSVCVWMASSSDSSRFAARPFGSGYLNMQYHQWAVPGACQGCTGRKIRVVLCQPGLYIRLACTPHSLTFSLTPSLPHSHTPSLPLFPRPLFPQPDLPYLSPQQSRRGCCTLLCNGLMACSTSMTLPFSTAHPCLKLSHTWPVHRMFSPTDKLHSHCTHPTAHTPHTHRALLSALPFCVVTGQNGNTHCAPTSTAQHLLRKRCVPAPFFCSVLLHSNHCPAAS